MPPTVEEYALASMQPSSVVEAATVHSAPTGGGSHDAVSGRSEGAAFVVDRSRPSIFRKILSRLATFMERRPMAVPLSPTTRYNANSRREYRKESLYIRPIRLSGNLLRAGLDISHAPSSAQPGAAALDGSDACYVLVAFVDCSDATVATLVNGKGRIVDSRLLERGFKQRVEFAIGAKDLPSLGAPPRTLTVHIQQEQGNTVCPPCEWCVSPGWCACEASCEGAGARGGAGGEAPATPSRSCDGAPPMTPKGMERGRRMPLPGKESPPMQVSILRVTSQGAAGRVVRDAKRWLTLKRAQGADCESIRSEALEAFDVALVEQRLMYGERDFGILEVYGQKADEEESSGAARCSNDSAALKAKELPTVDAERVQESSAADPSLFVAEERSRERDSRPSQEGGGGALAAGIGRAGESCLTLAMVEREYERDNADCVICLTNARDTLLLPCRHMCICIECADTLGNGDGKCPLCRQTYASMITIKDEGAAAS